MKKKFRCQRFIPDTESDFRYNFFQRFTGRRVNIPDN